MYQRAATWTPCKHIKNQLPPPFFQRAHQERPPPGTKPPKGPKGHNLRQPQPPKGRSSPDTKARTVLIAISTTPLPLLSSHSYPPAPPQKHIQVAGVQEDFPPCFYWLFSGFIQWWRSDKLVEVLKQRADSFLFLLFFSLFKHTKNMPCVALRADFPSWFLI